jgi:hypothetical protein
MRLAALPQHTAISLRLTVPGTGIIRRLGLRLDKWRRSLSRTSLRLLESPRRPELAGVFEMRKEFQEAEGRHQEIGML